MRLLLTLILLTSLMGLTACAGSTRDVAEVGGVVSQETGLASYYGHQYHGRTTANGETYDENKLTAAHRTLPFGTLVRVTNLQNGKSVLLRVNDRGPFSKNRIIDLSRKAAQLLGFEGKGTARVRVEILPAEKAARLRREFIAFHEAHRSDAGILMERPYVITVGRETSGSERAS